MTCDCVTHSRDWLPLELGWGAQMSVSGSQLHTKPIVPQHAGSHSVPFKRICYPPTLTISFRFNTTRTEQTRTKMLPSFRPPGLGRTGRPRWGRGGGGTAGGRLGHAHCRRQAARQ